MLRWSTVWGTEPSPVDDEKALAPFQKRQDVLAHGADCLNRNRPVHIRDCNGTNMDGSVEVVAHKMAMEIVDSVRERLKCVNLSLQTREFGHEEGIAACVSADIEANPPWSYSGRPSRLHRSHGALCGHIHRSRGRGTPP